MSAGWASSSSSWSASAWLASSRYSAASSVAGSISIVLDALQRALGEGREAAQRLDFDVEELDAHGVVAGRREDVEDVAAGCELAAVLDAVDALVAARDEVARELVEVGDAALLELETVGAQFGIRDALGERAGADHDDRVRALGGDRVERGDAQTDEVRRRIEVRLVQTPRAG